MGEVILEMRGITKEFPGVKALNQVHFAVRRGEVHALIGENGAGKSTLMKILTGIYKPTAGELIYKGKPFFPNDPKHAQTEGISIIHQELNLLNDLDVAENIYISREPRKYKNVLIDDKRMHESAGKLLKRLGLDIDPYEKVRNLSVAQKQMIEIAKALSVDSEVLILDEPTSTLSEKEVQVLFGIIRKLREENVAIVYISHRLEEFDQIVDWVTVLRDGSYVDSCSWKEQTIDNLVKQMVGREITEQFPKRHAKIGEVVFEAKDITQKRLLKKVSIQVRAGEVVGLAGLVGAGRTELARAIFGADHIESGEFLLGEKSVKIRCPDDAIRSGIVYLPEDRKKDGVFLDQSVAMNITIANLREYAKNGVIREGAYQEAIQEKIQDLRIKTPSVSQLAQFLSGGNQQKVLIARWLCRNAKVIIFDEPTRGIDVGAKYEVYSLINRVAENGAAVIMISSDMAEILGMSDRIVVMCEGRVTGELSGAEATQEAVLHMASDTNKDMRKVV